MHQNAFRGRAPPGPIGELTALPQTSWLDIREGMGRKEKEGEREKDLAPEKKFWRRHCPRPLCSRLRPDVRDRRQTRIIA